MKTLFILNEASYGSERTYNGLRLAGSLSKREDNQVKVFLMGDAATAAHKDQKVPQGFYLSLIHIYLNTVKIGQKVAVKAAALNINSTGTVSYVGALVGEQTRTALARVVLSNPKGEWRPGLPVNIELTADEIEVPVAVSADAIQTLRDWNVVFGRYGEYFEARPIGLGRSDGKFVEVVSGLNVGEQYAAKNSYCLLYTSANYLVPDNA